MRFFIVSPFLWAWKMAMKKIWGNIEILKKIVHRRKMERVDVNAWFLIIHAKIKALRVLSAYDENWYDKWRGNNH